MEYVNAFLTAMIITILIETTVLFILQKKILKKEFEKIPLQKIIFTGIFCSFATIPYLWFVLPEILPANLYIIVGELLIVIIEGILISQILELKIEKAIMVSALCNSISYGIGILIF